MGCSRSDHDGGRRRGFGHRCPRCDGRGVTISSEEPKEDSDESTSDNSDGDSETTEDNGEESVQDPDESCEENSSDSTWGEDEEYTEFNECDGYEEETEKHGEEVDEQDDKEDDTGSALRATVSPNGDILSFSVDLENVSDDDVLVDPLPDGRLVILQAIKRGRGRFDLRKITFNNLSEYNAHARSCPKSLDLM